METGGKKHKMNLYGYYPKLMPSYSILKVENLTQSFLEISQVHKVILGSFLRLLKPYLLYRRAQRILLPCHLKCLYHDKLNAPSCHLETTQPNAIHYSLYSARPWIIYSKIGLHTFYVVWLTFTTNTKTISQFLCYNMVLPSDFKIVVKSICSLGHLL